MPGPPPSRRRRGLAASPRPGRVLAVAAAVACAAAAAHAQKASPAGEREFSTDRPDTTESPFTVEAGRLQTETTLFGWTRSRRDPQGVVTDTFEAGTTNLRIGLTPRLEADVVLQPYGRVHTSDGSGNSEGVGDLTLRAKLNLWGADGVKARGDTAFALLPFVDIPLDRGNGVSDDRVGGGLILPLGLSLDEGLDLGLNAGVHVVREDPARGYEAQVMLSASLGREWTETLGTYYELAAVVNRRDPAGQMLNVNTGVTYKVRRNVQLDVGTSFGVSRASDPFAAFVGISARF